MHIATNKRRSFFTILRNPFLHHGLHECPAPARELLFVVRFIRLENGRTNMNLTLWLPAMFLLGLMTMALLFAFLVACEKI